MVRKHYKVTLKAVLIFSDICLYSLIWYKGSKLQYWQCPISRTTFKTPTFIKTQNAKDLLFSFYNLFIVSSGKYTIKKEAKNEENRMESISGKAIFEAVITKITMQLCYPPNTPYV